MKRKQRKYVEKSTHKCKFKLTHGLQFLLLGDPYVIRFYYCPRDSSVINLSATPHQRGGGRNEAQA